MSTSAIPDLAKCPYCDGYHPAICPRIKSIEFSEISPALWKRVEFFAPNDYPSPPTVLPQFTAGMSENGVG